MTPKHDKPKAINSFQDLGKLLGSNHKNPTALKAEAKKPWGKKEDNRKMEKERFREKTSNDRVSSRREENNPGPQFPLPLTVTTGLDWKQCENFSLLFHRFIPHDRKWDIFDKEETWRNIVCRAKELSNENLATSFLKRQRGLENLLKKKYGENNVWKKEGKTVWRLAIGLGNTSPLDTGITLHPLYGIPYLPGSAVKGICRAWKFEQLTGTAEDNPERKKFNRVFGVQKEKGEIEFYDAYPCRWDPLKGLFVQDIINVHYQPYYGDKTGTKPPADYYNPVPNSFLAVNEGVSFRFVLATQGEMEEDSLLDDVGLWLKSALEEFGIGAKTAVGYGEIHIGVK